MRCAYPSLLSRDESTAIKGFLILLVVLGHNSLITGNVDIFGKHILYQFLYSFHVYCFYILPFIYGLYIKDEDLSLWGYIRTRIRKYIRLYLIYLIFSVICVGIFIFIVRKQSSLMGFIYAFIFGSQPLLNHYTGFSFLWFLPTICAVMWWRDIYFCMPRLGKILFILLGFFLWTLAFVGVANFHAFGSYIPFALCQGVYFSLSAIAARAILMHLKVTIPSQIIGAFSFVLILAFTYYRDVLPPWCTYFSWSLVPVIAFVSICQYKHLLCKSKFMILMGKYSLEIYLVHIFIFNACLRIVPRNSLLIGFGLYVVTLAASLLVSILLEKNRYTRHLFFS